MLRRKSIFFPYSLFKKSSYLFSQSFVHILVKSNEKGGRDEIMTPPILYKTCMAYRKNGFDRNSSNIFCEHQMIFACFEILQC